MKKTIFLILLSILLLPITSFAQITELTTPEWQTISSFTSSSSGTNCDEYDDDPACNITGIFGSAITIGGTAFTGFHQDPNGYVELLASGETPWNYGYGGLFDTDGDDGILGNNPSAPSATETYIFAGYDDLDTDLFWDQKFGYQQLSDRTIFYWDMQLYIDEQELSPYQVVLYNNGAIDWNFSGRDGQMHNPNNCCVNSVSSADLYDMYTGVYLGNTATLEEAISGDIPWNATSYRLGTPPVVPEPISSTLFLIGGAALGFRRYRKTITN